MNVDKPSDDVEAIKNRPVEGIQINRTTSVETSKTLQVSFTDYFMMFTNYRCFTPNKAPFVTRSHKPEWFTREFPATSFEHENESREIWEAFLIPKFLSTRLGTSKSSVRLFLYQPNLVARRFHLN